MSYDVRLFVPAGTGSLDEQMDALDGAAPGPLSTEDESRLAALLEDLKAIDPDAVIEEERIGGRLHGFVVEDSEELPYVEAKGRTASLAMGMGTDSHVLYATLHQMSSLFHARGFVAFDHQLGAFVEPATQFRPFMQQFASQWDSPQHFADWLARDSDAPAAAPRATPEIPETAAPPRKRPPVAAIIVGVLLLIWAAHKLHKAGYF